jgi:alginate O-acetyltransferase complex protein AlgI
MLLYLPVVLVVYYVTPMKWRNLWLFLVNFVFYGWGEPKLIVLMLFSITINYINGMLIGKYRETDKKKAKFFLIENVVVNLALLFFFKYTNLFIDTINDVAGRQIIEQMNISLPIGISFYTFQTMSYPIDVYRGDTNIQRNYVSFGTYVALFPQLIAGPIVRYKDIDDQLSYREHSVDKFASGVRRFTIGLAKKVLLANNVGILWDTYAAMGANELTLAGSWLGIIAFTLQIYFDFSGYSDMAIGLGRMLGFEFLENFKHPYISRSVTEFWRRWHISLGTWFRDYVYIPLGGNRKGQARQYLNIMIVWGLTGFWHGANWTFLLWGLYYGVLLMVEKRFLLERLKRAPKLLTHVYVMLIVIVGWVVFQLDSISHAGMFYAAMFGFGQAGAGSPADIFYLLSFAGVLIAAIIAATPLPSKLYMKLSERTRAVTTPVLILAALTICTAYLVNSTYNPFLYFKF